MARTAFESRIELVTAFMAAWLSLQIVIEGAEGAMERREWQTLSMANSSAWKIETSVPSFQIYSIASDEGWKIMANYNNINYICANICL